MRSHTLSIFRREFAGIVACDQYLPVGILQVFSGYVLLFGKEASWTSPVDITFAFAQMLYGDGR